MSTRRTPRPAVPALPPTAPGTAGPGAPSGGITILGHRVSNDAIIIALASLAGIVVLYRAAKPSGAADAPMVLGGADPISSVPAAGADFPSQGGPSQPGDSTVIIPQGIGAIPVTPHGPGPGAFGGSPVVGAINPVQGKPAAIGPTAGPKGILTRPHSGIIRPLPFNQAPGSVSMGVRGLSHPQLPQGRLDPLTIPQHTPVATAPFATGRSSGFVPSMDPGFQKYVADERKLAATAGISSLGTGRVAPITTRPAPPAIAAGQTSSGFVPSADPGYQAFLKGERGLMPSTVHATTTQGSFAPPVAAQPSHAPANVFAPKPVPAQRPPVTPAPFATGKSSGFVPSASGGFISFLAGERAIVPASMPTPPKNPTPHTNAAPVSRPRSGGPRPKPAPAQHPAFTPKPRPVNVGGHRAGGPQG